MFVSLEIQFKLFVVLYYLLDSLTWGEAGELIDGDEDLYMSFDSIAEVMVGKQTRAFHKKPGREADADHCLSIASALVVLNLQASSELVRDEWINRLKELAPNAVFLSENFMVDGDEFVVYHDDGTVSTDTVKFDIKTGTLFFFFSSLVFCFV